jgi:hypothetical protein
VDSPCQKAKKSLILGKNEPLKGSECSRPSSDARFSDPKRASQKKSRVLLFSVKPFFLEGSELFAASCFFVGGLSREQALRLWLVRNWGVLFCPGLASGF